MVFSICSHLEILTFHTDNSERFVYQEVTLNLKEIALIEDQSLETVPIDSTDLFFVKLLKDKKDTLVGLKYLSQDFRLIEVKFNYPTLKNKTFSEGYLKLSNDSISFWLKEHQFDSLLHSFSYYDSSKIAKKYNITEIDNQPYFGSDGEMPKTEIQEIKIVENGITCFLEKESFGNLYNPSFSLDQAEVFLTPDGRFILNFWGSDGAGGYYACLVIRSCQIQHKIVDLGF